MNLGFVILHIHSLSTGNSPRPWANIAGLLVAGGIFVYTLRWDAALKKAIRRDRIAELEKELGISGSAG